MTAAILGAVAVAAFAVVVVLLVRRVQDLEERMAGLAMEVECVRRSVGVTDVEVRDYHYEQHPGCRPGGEER